MRCESTQTVTAHSYSGEVRLRHTWEETMDWLGRLGTCDEPDCPGAISVCAECAYGHCGQLSDCVALRLGQLTTGGTGNNSRTYCVVCVFVTLIFFNTLPQVHHCRFSVAVD